MRVTTLLGNSLRDLSQTPLCGSRAEARREGLAVVCVSLTGEQHAFQILSYRTRRCSRVRVERGVGLPVTICPYGARGSPARAAVRGAGRPGGNSESAQ